MGQMSTRAGGSSKKYFLVLVINIFPSNGKKTDVLILSTTHSVNQTIYRDNKPPYSWDKDEAILFHIHTLDTATYAEVTGNRHQRRPSAREPTRSMEDTFFAALEEQRAKEEGIPCQEEENVPQIVSVIGRYKSTFDPVGVLYWDSCDG
ncbi:hypothetical protein F4860DRAFT_521097 [Xylaria cubensis]|nr:hypothetical protein F4860DRAFT_521097 [Xylaria cubensis]